MKESITEETDKNEGYFKCLSSLGTSEGDAPLWSVITDTITPISSTNNRWLTWRVNMDNKNNNNRNNYLSIRKVWE